MRKIVLLILLSCFTSSVFASTQASTWGDWFGYLNPGNWCKRRPARAARPPAYDVTSPVSPASSDSFVGVSPIYSGKGRDSKDVAIQGIIEEWNPKDKKSTGHAILEMIQRSGNSTVADAIGHPKEVWGDNLDQQAQLMVRYINGLFDDGWTKPQVIQAVLTTLSTGALGYEIQGEVRRWLDQTTFTASLTEAGYRYFYFTPEGNDFKDILKLAMTVNLSLALTPYIPQRLAAFWDEFTTCLLRPCYRLLKDDNPPHHANLRVFLKTIDPNFYEHRLETTYPLWAEITGTVVALVSAGVMGLIPAYAICENNASFPDTAFFARTLPPFVGLFYGMDSFARFHVLKDKLLAKRYGGNAMDQKRQDLVTQIEDLEKRVLTMDADALKELRRQLHELKDLSTLFKEGYAACAKGTTSLTRWQKTKEAIPWVLGVTAALALACLYYVEIEQSLADGYQYFQTGKPSLSDTLRFFGVEYEVFQQDTVHMPIYNGNRTDWITQCFGSAEFVEGNREDGGSFHLLHCPGVKQGDLWTSGLGDFDYIEANAYGLYDWIDGTYAAKAGINNTNNGGIGLTKNSYVLPTGGKVFANLLAAITSGGVFGLATYSGKKLVNQIMSTNRCTNAFVLSIAVIESLVRAAPVGFSGWVNLVQALDPGSLYPLLAVGTVAMASTYVGDFDAVYRNTFWCAQEVWNGGKNLVNWFTGLCGRRTFKNTTLTHSALRTKTLLSLNKMKEAVTVAEEGVIQAIWNAIQPPQETA